MQSTCRRNNSEWAEEIWPYFCTTRISKAPKVTQGAPQMKRMGMYNANVRMDLSRPEMKIFNAEYLNYNNFDS